METYVFRLMLERWIFSRVSVCFFFRSRLIISIPLSCFSRKGRTLWREEGGCVELWRNFICPIGGKRVGRVRDSFFSFVSILRDVNSEEEEEEKKPRKMSCFPPSCSSGVVVLITSHMQGKKKADKGKKKADNYKLWCLSLSALFLTPRAPCRSTMTTCATCWRKWRRASSTYRTLCRRSARISCAAWSKLIPTNGSRYVTYMGRPLHWLVFVFHCWRFVALGQ